MTCDTVTLIYDFTDLTRCDLVLLSVQFVLHADL